jgi:hypothetical protein
MQPNAGTVGLGPCDSLIYTPDTPQTCTGGIDSFTYLISDGQGGTACATVTVDVLCAGFTFSGGAQDFNYDVTTGSLTTATGPFTVPLYLEELVGVVTQDVFGFTMVLQHDPGLLEVTDVQLGAGLITSGATICHSVVDDRVEILLVDIPAGISFDSVIHVIDVDYTTKPGGLRGNPLGLGSTLTWGPGSSVEIAALQVETAGTEVALQFTPEGPASSDPIVVFYAPGQTVALNGNGTTTFDQSLYLEAHDANGSALPIDGFSMSLAHGPEVDVIDVAKGAALDFLLGGIDPEFFAWQDEADGFVVGVVVAYESVGSEVLLAPTGQDPVQVIDVILVTYEVVAGTGDSPLTWEDLGSPPVENVVTIEAVSHWPQLLSGSFFLVPAAGTSAIEDCDDGLDNDDDGLIDCDDPDCLAGFPLPPLGTWPLDPGTANLPGNPVHDGHIPNPQANAVGYFGWSVSVSGDLLAVGAYLDNTPGAGNAGSVYLYEKVGGVWLPAVTGNPVPGHIPNPQANVQDYFGRSVSVSGDLLAVGAHADDAPGAGNAGSVYLYVRN